MDVYIIIFTLNNYLSYKKNCAKEYISPDSIKKILDIITLSLRSGDVVCRYSSVQFLVLITSKKREDVCTIAERIKGEINKQRINIRSEYSIEKINV